MTARRAGLALSLVVAALLAADCGTTGPIADAPKAGLPTRTVRLGDRSWDVLVAPADGMRGLSGFGGADGMLFDLGRSVDPGAVAFVMDGVRFPLDIRWFDEIGRQVGGTRMQMCAAEPCPLHRPERPFRWAIEAPVGAFADLGPDDRLAVAD